MSAGDSRHACGALYDQPFCPSWATLVLKQPSKQPSNRERVSSRGWVNLATVHTNIWDRSSGVHYIRSICVYLVHTIRSSGWRQRPKKRTIGRSNRRYVRRLHEYLFDTSKECARGHQPSPLTSRRRRKNACAAGCCGPNCSTTQREFRILTARESRHPFQIV